MPIHKDDLLKAISQLRKNSRDREQVDWLSITTNAIDLQTIEWSIWSFIVVEKKNGKNCIKIQKKYKRQKI